MTARPPVVGILGASYPVRRPWGELTVVGTPRVYVDAVSAAGGLPVVVPLGGPPATLELLDAAVLTGGGDVDPARYGGDPAAAREVDRDRDTHELAAIRWAERRRLPLLGVCRGLQLLTVAFGGRLAGAGGRHVLPHTGHPVELTSGSLLAGLLGARPDVSSLHEQVVSATGAPWRVVGRADDGAVEACEWAGADPWPVLGVQWHPERDATGPALFGWLVDTAGRDRAHGRPSAGPALTPWSPYREGQPRARPGTPSVTTGPSRAR